MSVRRDVKNQPSLFRVLNNDTLTPNMQRITLTSPTVEQYPTITSSAYVKLLFDINGNPLTQMPTDRKAMQMRTYTIRSLDHANQTITLDMVRHDHGIDHQGRSGPAANWAGNAKPGDNILIGGPGSSKELVTDFDWVLFMGDMTSLPAISHYLERLAPDTVGYAVIRLISEADRQHLVKPEGVELTWVTDPEMPLVDQLESLDWLSGRPAVWVACEFAEMRALRQHLKSERQLELKQMYISSYWRQGRSEDQHKIDKHKDQQSLQQSSALQAAQQQ